MAAILGGMAICAVPVLLFIPAYGIMTPAVYLCLCVVVFAAVTVAMYGWIATKGAARFTSM
jgi:hypothetical protein